MSTASSAPKTESRRMGRVLASESSIREFLAWLEQRNPHEPEYLQAVQEAVESLAPVLERRPEFRDARLLQRLSEPERIVIFRVPWIDDRNAIHVNRGYRVQFNSALGPYKGGLRFTPTVNLSILKFLGFEQTLKNSLTGRQLGGAKGGADFHPRGRSDQEVMRFCQSFMTELCRHVGPDVDIPAGDIGVGAREIGFLFGQYKRLMRAWHGVLTGKPLEFGGSPGRTEATGYGVVYFASEMLATRARSLEGMRCVVSGAGNVAQHTVEKLLHLGARPIAVSDIDGMIHDPDGIDFERLAWIKEQVNVRRGSLSAYTTRFPRAEYLPVDHSLDHNPLWTLGAECAFPCATQNELSERDAANLIRNGIVLVCEGANMPSTPEAIHRLLDAGVMFGPAKAANAGGVAVSALEMAQNSQRETWALDEVDRRLGEIMRSIHRNCRAIAEEYAAPGNYSAGANIAGFLRVADAMLAQGVV